METVAEGLKFERLDEGWKVAGYEDIDKSVDIPAEVDGVPVTMVGAHAFEDACGLEHISIPESVTFVGNYAFWGCTSLTQVDIPHSLTVLNLGTFRGCTALAHVTVPDSMELLGDGVFQGCTALVSVDIPDSVVEVGDSCFRDCTGLETIVLPASVHKISRSAFRNCERLSRVVIPGKVEYVGPRAFQGCPTLETITVAGDDIDVTLNAFRNYSLMCFIIDLAVEHQMLPFDEAKTLLNSKSQRERVLAACVVASYPDRVGEIATKLALTRTLAEAGRTEELRVFEGKPGYLSKPAIQKCIDAANANARTETAAYLLDLLARLDGAAPRARTSGLEL